MVSRDSSVGIETGYGLDGRDSIPDRGEIFFFTVASRPSLGPTQRRILRVLVFLRRYSGRSVKLTTYFHLVPRSRMVELYLYSSIRLYGVVHN
jgi:hypothetical protein